MFKRKSKIVSGWSVTCNPKKFDGEVILSLGSYKKRKVFNGIIEDEVSIRLDEDQARKLCKAILMPFNE